MLRGSHSHYKMLYLGAYTNSPRSLDDRHLSRIHSREREHTTACPTRKFMTIITAIEFRRGSLLTKCRLRPENLHQKSLGLDRRPEACDMISSHGIDPMVLLVYSPQQSNRLDISKPILSLLTTVIMIMMRRGGATIVLVLCDILQIQFRFLFVVNVFVVVPSQERGCFFCQ